MYLACPAYCRIWMEMQMHTWQCGQEIMKEKHYWLYPSIKVSVCTYMYYYVLCVRGNSPCSLNVSLYIACDFLHIHIHHAWRALHPYIKVLQLTVCLLHFLVNLHFCTFSLVQKYVCIIYVHTCTWSLFYSYNQSHIDIEKRHDWVTMAWSGRTCEASVTKKKVWHTLEFDMKPSRVRWALLKMACQTCNYLW